RFDGHSGPQKMLRILTFVEEDTDGNALNDLHIVSCGIFRRQQAISSSACTSDAFHVPAVGAAVGINRNPHRLFGANVRHLGFFKVSRNPDVLTVEWNDGHELLPRDYVLTRLNRPLTDNAVDGRD